MVGEHRFRSATAEDADFLFVMLMEAVNWAPDRRLPPAAIAGDPVLTRYVDGWPRRSDLGVVAETDDASIGAVWLRLFTADAPGYGYVADDVPELSIGVVRQWRGMGVGRGLLQEMIRRARAVGYRAISLSVERENFAHGLYTSEGFQAVQAGPDTDTMVKEFPPWGRRPD